MSSHLKNGNKGTTKFTPKHALATIVHTVKSVNVKIGGVR